MGASFLNENIFFNPALLRTETSILKVDFLLEKMKNEKIFLPLEKKEFILWRNRRCSQFLELMILNIPQSPFFIDISFHSHWFMIDGLQRMFAFYRAFIKEDLILKGLKFLPQYEGQNFLDLPTSLQRRIEETEFHIHFMEEFESYEMRKYFYQKINSQKKNYLRYLLEKERNLE